MKSARTASLYIMTELTGEGTLELDRSALDVFGSPVAEITMPMTDWDREAHRELVKLALPQPPDPFLPLIPRQQKTIRRSGSTHQKECHMLSRTFTGITSLPYRVDGRDAEKDTPST